MQIKDSKSFITLANLTVIFGGLPFIIYFSERSLGYLSNEDTWYATGINHGPWRGSLEGLTVLYPLTILMLTSIVFCIAQVIKKKWNLFWLSLLMIFIQIIFIFIQMYFLTWAID